MPNQEKEKKLIIYWSTKKIIALLCCLLFIPTFLVFVFSLTLKTTIIKPQYYKNNLKKINAYDRLIKDGIPALILETQVSDNKLTDTLAKELSIYLIQKLVDPVWVENLTAKFIDRVVNYFTTPNQSISLNLDGSEKILTKVIDGLLVLEQIIPACNQTAENSSVVAAASLFNLSIDCSKMSMNLDEIKSDLGGIRQKIEKINFGVITLDKNVQEANSFIGAVSGFVKYLNLYFWLSLSVMLVLLSVVVILLWKRTAYMIESISLVLVIGSLFSLMSGLLAGKAVPTSFIGEKGSAIPVAIQSILNDFLKQTISGIFGRLEIYSGVVLVIFLAVYITTLILRKKGVKFLGPK